MKKQKTTMEPEDIEALKTRLKKCKQNILEMRKGLILGLIVSLMMIIAPFIVSYLIAVQRGMIFASVWLIVSGCSGFVFLARTITNWQLLFECQQEAEKLEAEFDEEMKRSFHRKERKSGSRSISS